MILLPPFTDGETEAQSGVGVFLGSLGNLLEGSSEERGTDTSSRKRVFSPLQPLPHMPSFRALQSPPNTGGWRGQWEELSPTPDSQVPPPPLPALAPGHRDFS